MAFYCHQCQKEQTLLEKVGRRESCFHCNADLHACLNCSFYETSAYNECLEPSAERVLEKDHANFCDYFSFVPDRKKSSTSSVPQDARARLEALFKKG